MGMFRLGGRIKDRSFSSTLIPLNTGCIGKLNESVVEGTTVHESPFGIGGSCTGHVIWRL